MNYEEHLSDTDVCVVAFASDGGNAFIPDVPNFEFGKSLSALGCSHVLMRDTPDRWYTEGIEGLGDNEETANYIRSLKNRYKKVITTGVSFGAWGSLMYGQMASVNEIVAISPLTVIGKAAENELPKEWHHRISSDKSLDIKPLFSGPITPKIRIFVSDGDGTELDMFMATRLGRYSIAYDAPKSTLGQARGIFYINVIHGHSHGGLAKHMRDEGWFEVLFR
jgi:hypothetical protein